MVDGKPAREALDRDEADCLIQAAWFGRMCGDGVFTDRDGWAHAVYSDGVDRATRLMPSQWQAFPSDACHVIWIGRGPSAPDDGDTPTTAPASSRRLVRQEERGDLLTVGAFHAACMERCLIDWDGYGYPVFGNEVDIAVRVMPSRRHELPDDATHVLWLNR